MARQPTTTARVRTRSTPVQTSVTRDTGPASGVRVRRAGGVTLFAREAAERADTMEMVAKDFESQQITDGFAKEERSNNSGQSNRSPIAPPHNPMAMMRMPLENNTLSQCIDAMVTNIEAFGHNWEYIGPDGQMESKEATDERKLLSQITDMPTPEMTLIELRKRTRADKETLGYAFWEVIRQRDADRKPVGIHHVPAFTMRITAADPEPTKYKVPVMRDGEYTEVETEKRFRRFVQMVNNQRVYFKEFGDPRTISPKTGEEDPALSFEESATEIIHWQNYSPGYLYGVPRWINQLPSILGSREAELVNLEFFRDNAIPGMVISVSGGQLSDSSMTTLEETFLQSRGRKSIHRVVVLEAMGDEQAAGPEGTIPVPKIEIRSMQGERQSDALWQDFDEATRRKVRSSFRIPPLLVGLADDYTRATAEQSLVTAESQVFGPERNAFDDEFSMKILAPYRPRFWRFRSNPPRMTDATSVLAAIMAFDKAGALTPNVVIMLANELFDLHVKPITETWADYPFAMVMALVTSGRLKGIESIADAPLPPVAPGGGIDPVTGKPKETPPKDDTTSDLPPDEEAEIAKNTLARLRADVAPVRREIRRVLDLGDADPALIRATKALDKLLKKHIPVN